MSCPLQVCRNSEPGLRAEASWGNLGGCDATGQSEGSITGSAGDGDGGFFRFLFEREEVEVAFVAPADARFVFVFALAALEDDAADGVDFLTLLLRFAATVDFFFLVAEEGAMINRIRRDAVLRDCLSGVVSGVLSTYRQLTMLVIEEVE